MVIKNTRVPGCLKLYPRTITEDKRWLTLTYSWSALSAKGVTTLFRYDGEMKMRFKNTFRGLYYQVEPNRQILLSSCIEGSALMIVVDVRKRAKTFLRSQVFKLSEENHMQIYSTKGIAVGFLALEDNTRLQIRSDQPFVMKNQRRLRWDDPAIKLVWPADYEIDPNKFIISVRDRFADTTWEMFRTLPDPAADAVDPEEEARQIQLDDVVGKELYTIGEDADKVVFFQDDVFEPADEFGEEEGAGKTEAAASDKADSAPDEEPDHSEDSETAEAEQSGDSGESDASSADDSTAETVESGEDSQEDEISDETPVQPAAPSSEKDARLERVHEMLVIHDPLDLLDDLEGPLVPPAARPEDIYAPEMPKLTGSRATNAGISIFWNNDYYTRGYIVMRRAEGEDDWTEIIRLPKGTAAYTDFDVLPGLQYTYTVKGYAYGRGGVRVWSEFDETGVTLSLTDEEIKAPELISVVAQNGGYLVRWFKVEGATAYRVFRRNAEDGEWHFVGSVTSDESAYLDLTAEEEQEYYYTVKAVSCRLHPELVESDWNERGLHA